MFVIKLLYTHNNNEEDNYLQKLRVTLVRQIWPIQMM